MLKLPVVRLVHPKTVLWLVRQIAVAGLLLCQPHHCRCYKNGHSDEHKSYAHINAGAEYEYPDDGDDKAKNR